MLFHQFFDQFGQILLGRLQKNRFVGPEDWRSQPLGPALAVIPCALNVATFRNFCSVNTFGRRAENEKVVVGFFVQIGRIKIGPIGPCHPNRLSKLLPEIIQIQFEILDLQSI